MSAAAERIFHGKADGCEHWGAFLYFCYRCADFIANSRDTLLLRSEMKWYPTSFRLCSKDVDGLAVLHEPLNVLFEDSLQNSLKRPRLTGTSGCAGEGRTSQGLDSFPFPFLFNIPGYDHCT